MSEMLSTGWMWYIAIITLLGLAACAWLLWANSTKEVHLDQDGEASETALHGDHVWDGDLQEYDKPLPRWWMMMFYITIVFSVAYLVLYPGLTVVPGVLGWTSDERYEQEVQRVKAETDPLYETYLKQDLEVVARDKGALPMGARLFQTYCVQCHGADMRGSRGFPNLVDADWQYAGTPEGIKESIMNGRIGVMTPFKDQLSAEQISDVAKYVLTLSGRSAGPGNEQSVARGEETYKQVCFACHGADGKGMQALGAPNLTDSTWLYGGSLNTIIDVVTNGRQGVMPAHKELLGEARVHLLAAYVYAQSRNPAQ